MVSRRIEDLKSMLQQVDALSQHDIFRENLESTTGESGGLELDAHTVQLAKQEAQFAIESLDILRSGGEIDEENQFALEAIVMPFHRPVVDIVDGGFSPTQLTNTWRHLNEIDVKQRLEAAFLSIGRLEIPDHPSLPYAGTGFVVGDGLLMTNRHVAQLFARGLGNTGLQFISGQSVDVDFLRENGRTQTASLDVARVLMINPYWDMALLEVTGLPTSRRPLELSVGDPSGLEGRDVVTVGYPGYDPKGDPKYQQIQNRIFRGTYYVKRMQPGQFRNRHEVKSYDRMVSAVTHDCSTLGGNSGSAVIDVQSGQVVGLHFAGAYLRANFAVSPHDLAKDAQVVDAGVSFVGNMPLPSSFYPPIWDGLSEAREETASQSAAKSASNVQSLASSKTKSAFPPAAAPAGSASTTTTAIEVEIPLRLSISLGVPQMISGSPASPQANPQVERETRKVTDGADGLFKSDRSEPNFGATTVQFNELAISSMIENNAGVKSEKTVERTVDAADKSPIIGAAQPQRIRKLARTFKEYVFEVLRVCDRNALRRCVWYIETRSLDGELLSSGSSVALSVSQGSDRKVALLTCRHVVDVGESTLTEIRCYPEGSGYNPDTKDITRVWKARPWLKTDSIDFVRDGAVDWVLLEIQREHLELYGYATATGITSPKKARIKLLAGFPFGNHTMSNNIVKAETASGFALSDTDPKSGTWSFKLLGATAKGYSGGPYFSWDRRLIGLHRGIGGIIEAVNPDAVKQQLERRGWQIDELGLSRRAILASRLSLLLACLLFVAGPGLVLWRSTTPNDQEIRLVESQSVSVPVSSRVEFLNVPDCFVRNESGWEYRARGFDAYEEKDGFVATERISFRHRLIGPLVTPPANLEFKVHQHLKFESTKEFYERMYDAYSADSELSNWYDAVRCPAITVKFAREERVFLDSDRIIVVWETKEIDVDKRTRFEIKAKIGNRSPVHTRQVADLTKQDATEFSLRNFCIFYNPDDPPTFQFDKNKVAIEMHSAVFDRGVITGDLEREIDLNHASPRFK